MTTEYDLGPASMQVARVAAGVRDEHLGLPTPCTDWSVADLLRHLLELTTAFAATARKTPFPGDGSARPTELPVDWREQLERQLEVLPAAWREPGAWEGEAAAGGVTMPAAVMGTVAIDELVLHGWDLARASGQPFESDPASVEASLSFAASMSVPGEEAGREGLYGPVVPVPDDASDLDRLLGYAGRDPRWAASGQMVGD
ncbi:MULTISPECIES: TIGR03086 family metal-binding protein [Prescottella]|uniref:TIGR03086 family metal-binding protein n=1 Tax=Prescottella TaxID=2979332 RepID=UPI000A11F13F|nr:TIGR03086 family metal-binding protein [Prescottella equi]ORL36223.1 TIGR03086 family protein [Prescottella equi]UNQ39827.1 TIGR03086 family metal-binding protein [Prescottella equi]